MFWLFLLFSPILAAPAFAQSEPTLAEQAVSTGPPFAFAPFDFSTGDFDVLPSKEGAPSARIVPGSLQWIRVDDVLVVPRAILEVTTTDIESGQVIYQGSVQPMSISGGRGVSRVLIALTNDPNDEITARILRGGVKHEWKWHIDFHPKKRMDGFAMDITCAKSGLRVEDISVAKGNWVYVGCRRSLGQVSEGLSASLNLEIFIAKPAEPVVNGIAAQPAPPQILKLQLTNGKSEIAVRDPSASFKIKAEFPEIFHRGVFSLGEGPYVFVFQSNEDQFNGVVPVTTMYASYWLNDSMRFVFFGAVTASPQIYSDMGTYLEVESFRGLDKRFSFNLLLGAHGLTYKSQNNYYGRLDPPQGFEFVIPGVFQRDASVSGGGFIQPAINGKSYYNCWLRWGKPSYFVEANYIYWTEQTTDSFLAREMGITFGMPLNHFF